MRISTYDNGKTINEVREITDEFVTALTHKMVTRNRQVVDLELKVDTTQFDESIERATEQLQKLVDLDASIRDELAHPAAVFPSTLHPLSRFIPPAFEAPEEYVKWKPSYAALVAEVDELQGANDDLAQRNAELSTEYQALRRKHRVIVDGVTELRSITQPWRWTYSYLDHLLANEVGD